MNSSQRRKAKREHPHQITLTVAGMDRFASYDKKVHQAVSWCKKNCKGTWKTTTSWDHADFQFASHKDATIFALKWI